MPGAERASFACSGLRTMFTSGTPSFWQSLTSIWPRLDAAAVCTSARCPSMRIVSTMPSAVSGFTNQDAPAAGFVPSGRSWHWPVLSVRYSEYIAPPIADTVRPISARAPSESPAATTTPAPSLPTGSDWPSRAAIPCSSFFGTSAVTTGAAAVPDAFAVLMSAGPKSSPRSEGLRGDASIRTTTSSGPGSGTRAVASERVRRPSLLISERI